MNLKSGKRSRGGEGGRGGWSRSMSGAGTRGFMGLPAGVALWDTVRLLLPVEATGVFQRGSNII